MTYKDCAPTESLNELGCNELANILTDFECYLSGLPLTSSHLAHNRVKRNVPFTLIWLITSHIFCDLCEYTQPDIKL